MRKPELGEFPVEMFKENPKNGRIVYCPNELRRLGESLLVQQQEPLTANFDYLLFGGHRRLRAAKLVGKKTLWAVLSEQALTGAESSLVTTFHNVHLTAIEKFGAVERWFQENPNGKAKDLAERIGYDASMISKIWNLSACIQAVKEAAASNLIGVSTWNECSKNSPEIQHDMLAAALNGATRSDLERKTRAARNVFGNGEKLDRVKITCQGATVSVAGDGLDLVVFVDVCERVLKSARKAMNKGQNLKAFAKSMKPQREESAA